MTCPICKTYNDCLKHISNDYFNQYQDTMEYFENIICPDYARNNAKLKLVQYLSKALGTSNKTILNKVTNTEEMMSKRQYHQI